MKKILLLITAAVLALGMFSSCSNDDSSSKDDKDSQVRTTKLDPEKVENGKKIAKAAIDIGALVLKPSMTDYVNRSRQKAADSNAKFLYTVVNTGLADFLSEGKSAESSCSGRKIKVSQLKDSTELDKYIYAELSKNGNVDDANISFVIENGKAVRTKWQNDDSSPIGAYPQKK